jgi:hypothetical protein
MYVTYVRLMLPRKERAKGRLDAKANKTKGNVVCYDDINVPTLHKDAKNLLRKLVVIGSGDGSAQEWCGQGNAISAELPLRFFRPVSGGPLEVGHFKFCEQH